MSNHGNKTENSSFLDVCFALKNNVFRTMNVADVCVIREISGDLIKCEYITDNNTSIHCAKIANVDCKVDDVVLVVFTNHDFRTSLNAFKNNQANTNFTSTAYHEKSYGVIVGVIYRKSEVN